MTRKTDRRKILAVLAGGLVLGIGDTATLAAWNNSEFATGTFTAGSFNLQGSTTSATEGFKDHNVEAKDAAATLSFSVANVAKSLSPGDTVYAPFWVRLDDATTNDATLQPASVSAGTGGNEENISYTIRAIGATDKCDSTATGTVVAKGDTLSALTEAKSVDLTKGATEKTAGTAVQLCFVVKGGDKLVPSKAGSATWKLTATSKDN